MAVFALDLLSRNFIVSTSFRIITTITYKPIEAIIFQMFIVFQALFGSYTHCATFPLKSHKVDIISSTW